MDEQSCYSTVAALLEHIPAYRYLTYVANIPVVLGPVPDSLGHLSGSPTGSARSHDTIPTTTAGGPPNERLHIVCRAMSEPELPSGPLHGRGYFETPPPAIHILYDSPGLGQGERRQTDGLRTLLTHELTHAVDALVHGLDLASCGPLACSEVRAAHFAECAHVWPPLLQRRCARALAGDSTAMVFKEPAGMGRACVEAVFSACHGSRLEDNPAAPGGAMDALMAQEREALQTQGGGGDMR